MLVTKSNVGIENIVKVPYLSGTNKNITKPPLPKNVWYYLTGIIWLLTHRGGQVLQKTLTTNKRCYGPTYLQGLFLRSQQPLIVTPSLYQSEATSLASCVRQSVDYILLVQITVSIPRQIQQVDLKHELIRYVLYILAFWNSLSTLQKCFSEAHVYHWFSRADLNNFQVAACFKSGHQFFYTKNIKLKTHFYGIILHFKDIKNT